MTQDSNPATDTAPTTSGHGMLKTGASVVGWGLYCASSWTWSIGIFLPILMLTLWGWNGYWVFAIPNVLGCAAFGYVLNRRRSRAMVNAHAPAMRWFSFATVVYQVFFIAWATDMFILDDTQWPEAAWPILGTTLTLVACAAAIALRGDLFWRWFAACATIAAVILFAILVDFTGGWGEATGSETNRSLLAAAPIIAAGFLLTPYLDATFHRALRHSPSRHSFAIFGVVFAFMLACSALAFDPKTIGPYLLPAVFIQWIIQLVFTTGVHLREIAALPHRRIGASLVCLVAIVLGTVLGLPEIAEESVYLGLLGLYAIPFPIYVIAAFRAGIERKLCLKAVTAILVLSAALAPLGWLGFVDRKTDLLLVVVVLVVLGGLVIGQISRNWGNSARPTT